MASLNSGIRLLSTYRPIIADGKPALFHCWVETSRIHRATSRSDITAVVKEVYGLCEFEDGTVRKIGTNNIRFLDSNEYAWEVEK